MYLMFSNQTSPQPEEKLVGVALFRGKACPKAMKVWLSFHLKTENWHVAREVSETLTLQERWFGSWFLRGAPEAICTIL